MPTTILLSLKDIKKIYLYAFGNTVKGATASIVAREIGINMNTLYKVSRSQVPVGVYGKTYNKIYFYFKERGIILGEQ